MDITTQIILLYIFVGTLEIILGFPLLLEKVKPNWFYGFRLPKTMSNKEIWYKSNKYVGRDLIIVGSIVVIGSFFLFLLKSEFSAEKIAYIGSAILVIPIIIMLIRGLIYLKNFRNRLNIK